MKIFSAQLQDLPRLMVLWEDRQVLLQQSDARFTHSQNAREMWEKQLCRMLYDETVFVLKSVVADRIAGFVIAETAKGGVALIRAIVLDAHKYYPGVGRALVKAIHGQLAQKNFYKIAVLVPRFHAVEQAFWRAFGAEDGTKHEWINENWELPAGCMWMTL